MVIDIALIVISLLVIVFAIRRGFVSSIFGLVAWVVSAVLVLKFSMPVSEWIYDNIVRDKIVHKLSEKLTEDYAYGTAQSNFSAFAVSMSEVLKSTSKLLHINMPTGLETFNATDMSADSVAKTITDEYLSTIVIYFIKWIVSIIGFLLLVLILNKIGRMFVRLIRTTPFKSADRLLGGIVGAIKAFVIVLVVSALLQISTGLIYSNNAIKTLSKGEYKEKEINYVKVVEDSKIVSFVNEQSPINKALYKW